MKSTIVNVHTPHKNSLFVGIVSNSMSTDCHTVWPGCKFRCAHSRVPSPVHDFASHLGLSNPNPHQQTNKQSTSSSVSMANQSVGHWSHSMNNSQMGPIFLCSHCPSCEHRNSTVALAFLAPLKCFSCLMAVLRSPDDWIWSTHGDVRSCSCGLEAVFTVHESCPCLWIRENFCCEACNAIVCHQPISSKLHGTEETTKNNDCISQPSFGA